MTGMKSMRRTAAERKAEDKADGMPGNGTGRPAVAPEQDDVRMHLMPHHVDRLFNGTPPAHGTEVEIHGKGRVTDVGSHDDMAGQPSHTMTISLHHAGADADQMPIEKGAELRSEIKDNMGKSEAKQADQTAARDTARGKGGDKEPEKAAA